jgi:glycosyltransferase involved in cell wall biosynthesis
MDSTSPARQLASDVRAVLLHRNCYEFAWMRRPIIASDTPAIRSLFRPESLVLCDPSKPTDFAEALIDLYLHPEKRARMVANASEDYQEYRWEHMAERYQQLLLSLCQHSQQEEQAYSMAENKA